MKIRAGMRQLLIYFFVFLLVTANLCGSSNNFADIELFQVLNRTSGAVSRPDGGNSTTVLSILQPDGRDAVLIRNVTRIRLRGSPSVWPGSDQHPSWYQQGLTISGYTEVCFYTGSLDNVFSLQRQQACQRLDIPPPLAYA